MFDAGLLTQKRHRSPTKCDDFSLLSQGATHQVQFMAFVGDPQVGLVGKSRNSQSRRKLRKIKAIYCTTNPGSNLNTCFRGYVCLTLTIWPKVVRAGPRKLPDRLWMDRKTPSDSLEFQLNIIFDWHLSSPKLTWSFSPINGKCINADPPLPPSGSSMSIN